jgi:hypothetical protein
MFGRKSKGSKITQVYNSVGFGLRNEAQGLGKFVHFYFGLTEIPE